MTNHEQSERESEATTTTRRSTTAADERRIQARGTYGLIQQACIAAGMEVEPK